MPEKLLQPEMGLNPKNYGRLAELMNFWVSSINESDAKQTFSYTIRNAEGVYLVMVFFINYDGSPWADPSFTIKCNGKEYPNTGIVNEYNSNGFHVKGVITIDGVHLSVGDTITVSVSSSAGKILAWACHYYGE